MKKTNFFVLIVLIALLSAFATFFFIERSRIVQVNRIAMDVGVTEDGIIGINVDTDAFHFGSLARGQGSRRELTIKDVEEDVMVTSIKKGEIADWVSVPNGFIVRKGEEKNISISVGVPLNAEPGNYTGEITFVLKKV